jgi:BirA family biotin operon repressor/biotin-[acetyl-CoA-carboxylase] ligase
MFTKAILTDRLPVRGLGSPLYFFDRIGSTNDHAADLARQGTPHGTLVVADEQTHGKGRAGRTWITKPGTALAFSLLIRPKRVFALADPGGMNVLGALAVANHLQALGAQAWIKWPNDVLLAGIKVAGILAEASWLGDQLAWVVLGVGVNVRSESVPDRDETSYPATSLDQGLGREVDRVEFLLGVLDALGRWLGKLGTDEFNRSVRQKLAFIGERVELLGSGKRIHGTLEGIDASGKLKLRKPDGELVVLPAEEFQLIPRDPDEI